MEFRITADEQRVLFLIVDYLDAGDAPTADELSRAADGDVLRDVASLRAKGWILVRHIDEHPTVIGLSPMAVAAVRNLRYGRRG